MRPLSRRILAITIAAAGTVSARPAAASAEMEVGMQDDLTVVEGLASRELALDQFVAMGGTHVRMMVDHLRGSDLNKAGFASQTPVELYDQAVDAILARGLTPQITLFYRGQTNPRRWAAWAKTVAKHFGSKVDRYSIGNEPDLYEIEAKRCTPAVQKALRKQFPKEIKGNRAAVKTTQGTVKLKDACNRYQRGVTYRKIFNPAAKGVRAGNRSATVLAGETSPNASLDWFFKAVKPGGLNADGWAHHPFQYRDLTPAKAGKVWGVGQLDLLKKTVKMPVYLTEFGYPRPNSTMDKRVFGRRLTPKEVAKATVAAWKVARAKGAKQMLQYQWFKKPSFRTEFWDTAILNDDNGQTSPAYDALKAYISSW
jgi:hypothetical protein